MPSCGFCGSGGPERENKRIRFDRQILWPGLWTEKVLVEEDDSDTIAVGALGTIPKS